VTIVKSRFPIGFIPNGARVSFPQPAKKSNKEKMTNMRIRIYELC